MRNAGVMFISSKANWREIESERVSQRQLLVLWIRALKRVTWKMPAYANRLFESGM
jgi:hypothetical protein